MGEYHSAHQKLRCRCLMDGYEWDVSPHSLLRGDGCPRCSGKERYTPKSFAQKLSEIRPNVVPVTNYQNSFTPMTFRCLRDGYEWTVRPAHLISGESGCPCCAGVAKKTHQQFVSEIERVNPDVQVLGKYINDSTSITCVCKRCGRNWSSTPNALLRGNGCSHCKMSNGERQVAQYLESHQLHYVFQKRFEDCRDQLALPFDFYLESCNTLIEYDGEQHFHPVKFCSTGRLTPEEEYSVIQRHDRIKTDYCRANNYHLIRIAYTDFDRIPNILDELIA